MRPIRSLSAVAEKAKAYPRLDWQAESTIALQPDLVLIGQNDRPVTKHILRAQGLRLYEIALISDLDAARRQIIEVAAVLGSSGARRETARRTRCGARTPACCAEAAVCSPRCWSTAAVTRRATQSLAAALLAEAGLKPPPGAPPGYGGYVPLEKLLMLRPDAIVLNNLPRESDQGSYNLSHPALDRALSAAAAHRAAATLHDLRRRRADRGVRLSRGAADAAAAQSPTMRTN